MSTTEDAAKLASDLATPLAIALAQFDGSETFTRHWMKRDMAITEGAVFLVKEAGAAWLTDIVASAQGLSKVRAQEFQVWKLQKTTRRGKACATTVTMTDGDSDTAIYTQHIEFTDFPLDRITLWLERGSVDGVNVAWVLMLPGER